MISTKHETKAEYICRLEKSVKCISYLTAGVLSRFSSPISMRQRRQRGKRSSSVRGSARGSKDEETAENGDYIGVFGCQLGIGDKGFQPIRRRKSTLGDLSAALYETRHVASKTYRTTWYDKLGMYVVLILVVPPALMLIGPFYVLLRVFTCLPWPPFLPVGMKKAFGRASLSDGATAEEKAFLMDEAEIAKVEALETLALETRSMGWGFPWGEDNGMFWYGCGNVCSKGPGSEFFDKEKPSVIYIHGWEPGTTKRGFRETINWRWKDALFAHVDTLDVWISKGYNCGIYYWNGQSDELDNELVERKIYDAGGAGGMRYMYRGGARGEALFYDDPLPEHNVPISEQVLKSYLQHGFDDSAGVTVVGHSLGCQVSLEFLRKLHGLNESRSAGGHNPHPFPARLSLLDPFFSRGAKSYLPLANCTTAAWASNSLKLLGTETDLSIDSYVTSIIGHGLMGSSASVALKHYSAYNEIGYEGISWVNVKNRHICAVHMYFVSLVDEPGSLRSSRALLTNAASSNADVQSSMPCRKK